MYHHSGKHAQLEPVVREVLAGRLKVLGENHPDTLACQLCAAMLHATKREYDKAETELLKVLANQRRVLGNEHPTTLTTEGNLGWVYMAAKKHDKAVEALATSLEKERNALGPDHLLTMGTQHNLAAAYVNVGKLDLAEQCYLESIERGRKALGTDQHELIQKNLDQLGRLYQEQGKHEQAQPLLVDLRALPALREVRDGADGSLLAGRFKPPVPAARVSPSLRRTWLSASSARKTSPKPSRCCASRWRSLNRNRPPIGCTSTPKVCWVQR